MSKVKKAIIALATITILIGMWFVAYRNHKSTSNFPQLSAIAQMDEEDVNELLVGYYRAQLPDVWVGPDLALSRENTWIWRIDDNTLLTVSSNKVGEKAKIVSTSIDSVFIAEVLEIVNGYIMVKPADGTREAASSDLIEVPLKNMEPSPEPQVGDTVKIIYAGDIQKAYPTRLVSVYHISIVE